MPDQRPGSKSSCGRGSRGPWWSKSATTGGVSLPGCGEIFGRFFRVGDELERDKPGTGLGLYIVRQSVRRLQGTVCVADRPDHAGAVFEVHLPGSPTSEPAPGP